MIVELAERDMGLFRKLDMAAAMAEGDDDSVRQRLRRAIDEATSAEDYVDYYGAAGWAADVEEVLDSVASLIQEGRGALARELAERALDRIADAIESLDDSDGHCGALLSQARDIHLDACRVAPPDPVELASELFERELGEDYDTFFGAAQVYADVLGEAGLAEYRRLASEAWDKQPPRNGPRGAEAGFDSDRFVLERTLDFFAERDGDLEARIALRAKDLSSTYRYLMLAAFCLEQGQEAEALRYAEEGLWLFEDDRPDERLAVFAAELMVQAGRERDAGDCLWRAFAKAPSHELYRRLAALGGGLREKALTHLEARTAEADTGWWGSPSSLLVVILTEEGLFADAWAAVRRQGASTRDKLDLAKASEATHPCEALAAYAEQVETLANTGGNGNYGEAAALITRMAGLRDESEQAAYLSDLKERHRRKRNFMKLLG